MNRSRIVESPTLKGLGVVPARKKEGRGKKVTVTIPEGIYRGLEKLSKLEGAGSSPTALSNDVVTTYVREAVQAGVISPEDLESSEGEEDSAAVLLEKYRTLCSFFKLLFETRQTNGLSRAEVADLLGVDPVLFETCVSRFIEANSTPPRRKEKRSS